MIPAGVGPAGGTAAETLAGSLTRAHHGPRVARATQPAEQHLPRRPGGGPRDRDRGHVRRGGDRGRLRPARGAAAPKPTLPGSNETAIELPWRLLLSPSRDGAFFHSEKAVEGETGRTELWHTRLGSTQNGDIAKVDPKRILRAIWALSPPGWKQVTTPTDPKDLSYMPEDVDDDPFRASLNEYERHSAVHLSSNYRLRKPPPSKGWFEPDPLDVDHMALSSLGGWLDSRGAWKAASSRSESRSRSGAIGPRSGVTTSSASSRPAGSFRSATARPWSRSRSGGSSRPSRATRPTCASGCS